MGFRDIQERFDRWLVDLAVRKAKARSGAAGAPESIASNRWVSENETEPEPEPEAEVSPPIDPPQTPGISRILAGSPARGREGTRRLCLDSFCWDELHPSD